MCEQCEVMTINGVLCHEHGCPDAWKDYERECDWCGTEFIPENRDQIYCCPSCAASYYSD